MLRSRQRGQALVEFGLIAITFVMLLFIVIDTSLLLYTWLRVNSASRELARSASVGMHITDLEDEAKKLALPSLNLSGFTGGPCCGSDAALEVQVNVFSCVPSPGCSTPTCALGSCPTGTPAPDNILEVRVVAHGAEVITPLVRALIGCSGADPICPVPLGSTTITRYEGDLFP